VVFGGQCFHHTSPHEAAFPHRERFNEDSHSSAARCIPRWLEPDFLAQLWGEHNQSNAVRRLALRASHGRLDRLVATGALDAAGGTASRNG
jgi:hypothetical protein